MITSDTMQILRSKPDDVETLTHIAIAAKGHWGYPEKWMQHWRELLTIRPEFISSHETYSAIIDGQTVGFYGLLCEDSLLWLEHLWVLPSAMGGGVGRALFAHALERARALGFQSLEIESDPNAVAFYEHMGARRIGANITELDGQPRELPILVYQIEHVVSQVCPSAMKINARYVHTNLIAREWRRLAAFYQEVFGCIPVLPERDLVGEWLERGSAVPHAHIRGVHLRLLGFGDVGPTLEIFQYAEFADAPPPPANRVGFGYIAFAVEDVAGARAAVLSAGGSAVGSVESVMLPGDIKITWVYVRDPEGNIIELQRRDEGHGSADLRQ